MFGSATTLTANVPTRLGVLGCCSVVTFPGNPRTQLANAFRYYFGKLDFRCPQVSQGNMLRAVVAADLTGDNVQDFLVSQRNK